MIRVLGHCHAFMTIAASHSHMIYHFNNQSQWGIWQEVTIHSHMTLLLTTMMTSLMTTAEQVFLSRAYLHEVSLHSQIV